MGYFSNGTEAELYKDAYCRKCLHWPDDIEAPNQCPVYGLHFFWNYEQFDNAAKKEALDKFIPQDGLYNGECRMFLRRPDETA